MRSTTWYVLYLLLLIGFNNGEETCLFCAKKSNTLGQHISRCTAKRIQEHLHHKPSFRHPD